MKTNFVSFDLELNQPSQKIIQIGAVAFSINPFAVLEELDLIINPNEKLADFIVKLTGITQESVDSGTSLQIAYGKLCELLIKHECSNTAVVWGNGDVRHLKKEVMTENQSKFLFTDRFYDVKTLYQSYRLANNLDPKSGLSKSLAKCGLKWPTQLKAHNALGDAMATAVFFQYFLDKLNNQTK